MRRFLKLAAFLTALSALCSPGIPDLSVPIRGLQPADLRDMFHEVHNGHAHEAIDLMEPRGTPVLAVAPGAIRKLFLSKPGGNTIYQFDQTDTFCYYYAHLDRYADNVREGMRVKAGDVLGYVGSTGNANANAPHLHFAIFALGPQKQWWRGTALDPYPALVAAVKHAK